MIFRKPKMWHDIGILFGYFGSLAILIAIAFGDSQSMRQEEKNQLGEIKVRVQLLEQIVKGETTQ